MSEEERKRRTRRRSREWRERDERAQLRTQHLRVDFAARQELRELVHLAGAEGDIDEREALEHLLLDRLRPAAPTPTIRSGCSRFSRLASPRCATKRLSADSRIEQC